MDCGEVKELLDAYALGAAEKEEARGLEQHVADCIRCWDQLTEAQRSVATLSLAVPLREASPSLRQRVLAGARRAAPERPSTVRSVLGSIRRAWPLGVGAMAAVAISAVVLSVILFTQVTDVRNDSDQLGEQVDQLRQIEAVRSAPDVQSVRLPPTPAAPESTATFYWSEVTGTGALICNKLETLGPGQAYQMWLFVDDEPIDAGTFSSRQGVGYQIVDLEALTAEKPGAVGVSIESSDGAEEPTGEMILYTTITY